MSSIVRRIITHAQGKASSPAARGTNNNQTLLLHAVALSALAFALACGSETTSPEIVLHPPATLTPMPEIAAADPFVCQAGWRSTPLLFNGFPRLPVNGAHLALANGGTQLALTASDRPRPFMMPIEDVFGFCTHFISPQDTGIDRLEVELNAMESSALNGFEYEYDAAGNRLGISFNLEQIVMGPTAGAGPQSRQALMLEWSRGAVHVQYLRGNALVAQLTVSALQQGPFTGAYVLLVSAGASDDSFNQTVGAVDAGVGGDTGVIVGNFLWTEPFAVCPGGARDDIAACLANGGSTALMIDEIRVTDSALPPGRIVRSMLTFSALARGARVLLSETVIP